MSASMTANLLYPRKSREVGKFSPVCVLYCINRPSQRLQRYSPCSCHGLGRRYGALTTDVGVRGLEFFVAGAALLALLFASYSQRRTWLALGSTAISMVAFVGCLFVITSHDQNQLRTRLAWLGSKIQPALDQQTVDGTRDGRCLCMGALLRARTAYWMRDDRERRAPPYRASSNAGRRDDELVRREIRMPSRRHRPLHPSWSRRRSLLHPSWRRRRRDPRPSLRNQNLPQPSKPPGRYRNIRWLGLSASRTCKSRRVPSRDS